jgi:hypothetical protein
MSLRFRFRAVSGIPPMSWCACLTQSTDTVVVIHGTGVEADSRSFFEGAWSGDYEARGFDEALAFCGSGARIVANGVRFSCPSHNLEHLYSFRRDTRLWISNSLAFLLSQTGEAPDPAHPDYYFDLLRHYRAGLGRCNKSLRTASGRSVRVYDCENLTVSAGLDILAERRFFGDVPRDFQHYMGILEPSVAAVIANAAHPSRSRRFSAVVAVSRGYDSPAVAVLAARHGCRDAVTLRHSGDHSGNPANDDGSLVAERLGLRTTVYDREDPALRAPLCEAEFYPDPFACATDRALLPMERQLDSALYLSGRHGEHFWNTDPVRAFADFREPRSVSIPGTTISEFRLRTGFIHFPVPYVGGIHARALYRISHSAEMAPWRLGGGYDRPIARRLIETAGVPRGLFGVHKMGGPGSTSASRRLAPETEAAFMAWYNHRVPATVRRRLVESRRRNRAFYMKGEMGAMEKWLRTRPALIDLAPLVLPNRLHHRWGSRYLYMFHFGLELMMQRYATARQD